MFDYKKHLEDGKLKVTVFASDFIKANNIIHVEHVGFYYFDKYWISISDDQLQLMIHQSLGDYSQVRRVKEILESIRIQSHRQQKDFVCNRNKITLLNGTLDISDWTRPGFYQDEYYISDHNTIQLNIEYSNASECPHFNKFLNDIFDNDFEIIATIQEIMGYCLTTSVRFEKAFIFYGRGSNGKSVLLNVISALLSNDNITTLSLSDIEKQFDRAKLLNKLVNISSEFEGRVLKSENFKKIVSGELVDAAFKYKTPFDFRPYCKIITSTNNLPAIYDKSKGLYRRLICIPFNKTINDEDQDKHLFDKLLLELPGILNFALAGLKRLHLNQRFTEGKAINELKYNIQYENDRVIQFVDQYCELNDSYEINTQELYESYVCFSDQWGYKHKNQSNFGRDLLQSNSNIKKVRKKVDGKLLNVYKGIKLMPLDS